MIIYNITIKITWEKHEEWLQWMLDLHVPEVLGTGCFEKHQLLRLLETDETEGPTYAFQYYAVSKAQYNRYIELYAPALRRQTIEKWGDNFIAFRSLMEVVN
ncbi:MAG: DUF4286 family protein [Bacteroidota bacterium]